MQQQSTFDLNAHLGGGEQAIPSYSPLTPEVPPPEGGATTEPAPAQAPDVIPPPEEAPSLAPETPAVDWDSGEPAADAPVAAPLFAQGLGSSEVPAPEGVDEPDAAVAPQPAPVADPSTEAEDRDASAELDDLLADLR